MRCRSAQQLRFAAAVAIVLGSFSASRATDYYVRTDGSDTNAGTSNSSGGAYRTIGKCVGKAVAGDRCLIQPGVYREKSVTQAAAGSLKNDNLRNDCSCTKGSATISCGAAPNGLNPGDFVQCDSGFGFSWTEVQAVSGGTITLVEGYRGATSANSGADTLDVARFVQIIGQGARPDDVVMTSWLEKPGDVTWAKESGGSCVWSYSRSGTADATWKTPQGLRDNNLTWDLNRLNQNGKDSYIYVEGTASGDGDGNGRVQSCPCGEGITSLTAVDELPGSWSMDSGKVYVHPRHTCNGGSYAGYSCLGDSDCPGSTCGSCKDPATLDMETGSSTLGGNIVFIANKDFTVLKNITFEANNKYGGGPGKNDTYAVRAGGNNSLYSSIRVNGGVFSIFPQLGGAPTKDTRYEHVDALDGTICTSVAGAYSGLVFYDFEIRGNYGNLISCDEMRGSSDQDRVVFDRLYLHRNFTDYIGDRNGGGSCNGNAATWDCSRRYWNGQNIQFRGNHMMYLGSTATDKNMDHIIVQNSVGEIATDGFSIFDGANAQDVWFVNNTFGTTGVRPHRLKAKFGNSSANAGGIKSYNNMFVFDYGTAISEGFIDAEPGVSRGSEIKSDYNLFYNLGIDANPGRSGVASMRVWEDGETLSYVINNYNNEAHSILVCGTRCAGASPGRHIDAGTDAKLRDIKIDDGDGTDYTPNADNWGVNAGTNAYCPKEDFYGHPRSDGQCDIGAIEYQSGSVDTTPPSAVTNFTAAAGDRQVTLSWKHSASSDNKGTQIRFRTDRYPTSSTDGTVACDRLGAPSASDSCVHAALTNGTTYFYSAFAYDGANNYATPVNAQATPAGSTNAPPSDVNNLRRTDVK